MSRETKPPENVTEAARKLGVAIEQNDSQKIDAATASLGDALIETPDNPRYVAGQVAEGRRDQRMGWTDEAIADGRAADSRADRARRDQAERDRAQLRGK